MEDIIAIVLIFGGGTFVALAMSPIGRAIAARISGGGVAAVPSEDVRRALDSNRAVLEEIEGLRRDIGELQERVDFTERMLARQREDPRLPGQGA
jgi:hypothetical protein